MFLRNVKEEILVDLKYLIGHPLFLSLLAFVAGLLLVLFQDMPPRRVVMAMGGPHANWGDFSKYYKKVFEENGVELSLVPSHGSENDVRRLMDPNDSVQVTLAVSGTINPDEAKDVSSMGRVYISPLWIFYRKENKIGKVQKLTDFQGKRINIEQAGTKANSLAKKLFAMNGYEIDNHFTQLDTAEAIDAMGKGEIDVVMFFSSPESAILQKLLKNPAVGLMNFERADAYSFLFDYLDKLIIPEGGLDLVKNIPPQPTQVIASPVELIVKNNLHPALKMLLMRAASEAHGNESYFFRRGTFPSFGRTLLPEDEEARLYYKYGSPKLSRYLPFWAVEPFYRMLVYTLPITLFIFAAMKNLSEYRLSRGRRKIYVIYEKLRNLEKEAPLCNSADDQDNFNSRLSNLDREAMQLRLPEELLGEYFSLLNFISSLRIRIYSTQKTDP